MNADMKSRAQYPQHLTRKAIAERLVDTPFGEPFSEAALCDSVRGYDHAAIGQLITDALEPLLAAFCDAASKATDAFVALAAALRTTEPEAT